MKKLCAMVIVASAVLLGAQGRPQPMIEWPYAGGEQARTHYSPAADITPANVNQLELAWQWEAGEKPLENGARPDRFEATPLMIDNVLYLSTSFFRVVALNAETGAELWAFDPKIYLDGLGGWPTANLYYVHRGVAFWREGNESRILMSGHNRLFSVDAKTGKLVTTFGKDGYVDLTEGMRTPINQRLTRQSSPPVVYKNLVIVGSSIPDHLNFKGMPPGTVAAYDVRTGKLAWVFYTIPQPGEFGSETWENDSWAYSGATNVWGPMSLDDARGLLYLPVSTPDSEHWGGRRPGANLFGDSLVCLDATTGKRKWHFQAVHHGLWNFDFSAPPVLGTITVDGKRIDAVAEVSKQGFTYVFDRVTGRPVWPIVERPVPTDTDVPGEKPWPTQPFPTKPPAYSPQGMSLADANDLTPEIHALAVEEMQKHRMGPLFTPPSLRGTWRRPTTSANWGGAGFDPDTGMLYVKPTHEYSMMQICKNDGSDPLIDTEYRFFCNEMPGYQPRSPNKLGGIPMTKPPYAEVVAIDLNKGEIAWRVPFGEGSAVIRRNPLLKGVTLPERLGSGNSTGPLVTKGGLVFAGSSDSHLYAFDKATGREVTRVRTPSPVGANPMTYKAQSGRQFVVVATGAGPDATLVAFALRTQAATAAPR